MRKLQPNNYLINCLLSLKETFKQRLEWGKKYQYVQVPSAQTCTVLMNLLVIVSKKGRSLPIKN